MSEAYVPDFLDDVALELYVIEKVTPLLVTNTANESTYDPTRDRMTVALGIQSVIGGMSLPEAVEKLGVRPLAFGSAWKVLDLLLEYSLAEAGLTPSNSRRWTITEKVAHAQAGAGQASPLSDDTVLWRYVLVAYVATEQVRHSLVHRRSTIGTGGEVTGVDTKGNPLPPVTRDEQVYFMRAVQRTVKYIQQTSLNSRDQAALQGELDQLAALTGLPSTGSPVVSHPPIPVKVPIENGQEVDLTRLKNHIRDMAPTVAEFDVRFTVGLDIYQVPLENIPDGLIHFSTSAPWLAAT